MDNLHDDGDPDLRPTLYELFSGLVFAITGMPVSRVLTVIVGLLILGGAIQYAIREGDAKGEVDATSAVDVTREVDAKREAEQSSQYTSEELEKKDFLTAVTFPNGFSDFPLPVQIEKLDLMIDRCNHLIEQKSDYSVMVQKKLPALLALKGTAMARSGLDPAPSLELLQQHVGRIADSSAQKDQHQYLLVSTYMKVLAADPDSDFYNHAITAISAIQETTPVPKDQATASVEAAMKYHHECKDKVQSGKLLQLLGERVAMAKDQNVSKLGPSLVDYVNFFSNYQGAAIQTKSWKELESETLQLLKQIDETPPQTLWTYNLLMSVTEQHLYGGDKGVALKIVDQLISVASSSDAQIRDAVLPKLEMLKTRINLFETLFPLSGFDVAGKTIGPPETEQTLIFFFNPNEKNSRSALMRVADNPRREAWSTTTYLVSVAELPAELVDQLKEIDSSNIVTDRPTSEEWLEKSGVEQVPYLIRLDKEGVVQRLSVP